MKISTKKIIDVNNVLGHIVLNGLTESLIKEINENKGFGKEEYDLKVFFEGEEINPEIWANEWQKQVDRMIKEEAVRIVSRAFNSLEDNLSNEISMFKNKISKKMDKFIPGIKKFYQDDEF